jgi:hypothetical protein
MFEIYEKHQQMHFGFMDVILLYSDQRHVSAMYSTPQNYSAGNNFELLMF